MEKFNMNYSDKNIPIPSRQDYKIHLISKTEKFIKQIRWKALEFLGKLESTEKETYGFKSRNCPPFVEEVANFEHDLMMMIKNIQFKYIKNDFQKQLKKDMSEIQKCEKVLIPADKSRNIYKMETADYDKLLHDSITKTYKKSDQRNTNNINRDAKKIAVDLDLEDRIEKMQESESYITVKDHKEDFPHRLSFRLINPSKSDIGKISKYVLDKINQKLRSVTEVNQWKNSHSVIEWFKNIRNKRNASFFVFDIESFYPLISLNLLEDAINFAKTVCNTSGQNIAIIMQARRTLLFSNGEPWVKKVGNEEFEVPMGCFDGAEICELVGIYNLYQSKNVIRKENAGLYRDDGLGVLRNLSGPEFELVRKRIIKIFKDCGLNITIKMNLKTVNFLDVRFDLVNNTYQPYRKLNNEPIYIKRSNHPPNILKELPKAINKRISDISCNENVFNNAKITYEKALKNSGFTEGFTYIKPDNLTNINPRSKKEEKKKNYMV